MIRLHILYDYAGIFGHPDAHIVPIHLSRKTESCFVAKDERICETVNCKSLLHFNAEIKTHIFVIFVEILMQACRIYTLVSYGEFATPLIARRKAVNLHV